ncbi:MAG: hypothetical protein HZC36_14505 [Armatimonadetes bacterium]|nr:hypothetical protein [Armatimonadota bacterium]
MDGRKVGLNLLGVVLVLLGIAGCATGGAFLALWTPRGVSEQAMIGALVTLLAWATLYLVFSLHPVDERKRYRTSYWFSALFYGFLGFSVTPIFESARSAAISSSCISNVKDLSIALLNYAEDYDDRLPTASHWRTILKEYGESGGRCGFAASPYSNAFNSALSLAKLGDADEPANTVMVFDAEAWGPNAAGGKDWLAKRHSGRARATVGMLDGHATRVTSHNEERVNWALKVGK